MQETDLKMRWAVFAVSGFILVVTVLVSFFSENLDTKPAYFLFATIAGFVFGATVINKFK